MRELFKKLGLGVVLLVAAMPSSAAARLSATETRLTHFVTAHNDEALALLERLVDINSGTMNFAGVREVGDIFRQQFDDLGFATDWIDGDPFGRAGTLVADRPGSGVHVLLIGHLDTVFPKNSQFQTLTHLDNGLASGPGVSDMKGGDVIMLQALKALHSIGALDDLNVTVVLSGDEEDAGKPLSLARADLKRAGDASDVVLGFEDGDGKFDTAVVARRGDVTWLLEVEGQAAHSSQIFQPEVGAGAIYEAARILDAFRDRLSGEADLTFNPGVIVGGSEVELESDHTHGRAFGKSNVVAQRAIVHGDLRSLTPEQLATAEQLMRQVVADHLPQTTATITFEAGYPPMASTPGNERLLAMFDRVSRDLGLGAVGAVDPRNAGAADISFVAERVGMALDGLGLSGTGGHTVKETGDLTKLPLQTQRVAVLLYRLAHGQGRMHASAGKSND